MVWTCYAHVGRTNAKKDAPHVNQEGRNQGKEPVPDGWTRLGKILKIEDKHRQSCVQPNHGRTEMAGDLYVTIDPSVWKLLKKEEGGD